MTKRTFTKEFLQEVQYGCKGEIVAEEITDISRWSIYYSLVFKYEGKFYETDYSVGATEIQDESPWQYAPDEIEVTEVEPYEKTVIDYRPVKGG